MRDIKGEIVKRYQSRGKFVIIARMDTESGDIFTFKVTDKCNKKDYFSNKYDSFEQCDRDAFKVAKGI